MLIPKLERDSPIPIYRQICESVILMADGGTLAPGERLPPTRVLARALGVHRSTVVRAYSELWALGYLESRPGSYSTVRRRARALTRTEAPRGTLIDWEAAATPVARAARELTVRLMREQAPPERPDVIDFSQLAPDRSLAPVEAFRRCLKAVLVEQGPELLDYGDSAGYRPLRETIARRLRTHGITVGADELVITNGAQQAIDLVLRLLTRPGDRIAVEAPTYGLALALFRLCGLEVQQIPMGPEGMDLAALKKRLERQRPALVYTIPNFHNPTGITTGQGHRERLLELCESRRVPILEDGFEEEMKYFGKAVLPIKSMDSRGVVIYVGTFSKVLFPGLRLGWVAAPPECSLRLVALQRASCIAGNTPAQAALDRFCELGLYEEHLRRIHKVYRARMQAALQGLREHLPPGVEWTQPAGGYTLWLRLPGSPIGEPALQGRLLRGGVKLAPGRLFFETAPAAPQFRLSVSCVTEGEIREGCRRLGQALAEIIASPDPARA